MEPDINAFDRMMAAVDLQGMTGWLATHGAEAADAGGKPAMHRAFDLAFEKQITPTDALDIARVLIAAGADPDARNTASGDSLLISAVSLCCPEAALMLVEHGADLEAKGLFNASPLHWAALLGFPDVCASLVDHNAELSDEDSEFGATPIEWAIHGWRTGTNGGTREQPACARIIRRAGGVFRIERTMNDLDGEEHAPMREALGI